MLLQTFIPDQSIYVASLFGTTIQLTNALHSAFNCPLSQQCCHALRHESFSINSECEYLSDARVLKQTFLGNSEQLLLRLENREELIVHTKETNIAERIRIGFNFKDVLKFQL